MTVVLAAVVAAAIALPHLVRVEAASPTAAATIWFCALTLRAVTMVAAAVFVVVVLPTTQLFSAITHWCWHTVIPVIAAHLGLDGHSLGDAASVLPSFMLAASMLSVAFGLARAATKVRSVVRRAQVGAGPEGTVMVADADVLVAAAGLHRPRVVVSTGALMVFDDEELAASLDHERGHIARRHRFVLVAAQFLRALARPLPGTRGAVAELVYHLERDADRWAVARRHDPLALASAICKAATASFGPATGVSMALGGGAVTRRVRELTDGGGRRASSRATRVLVCAMVALTVTSLGALPAAASRTDGPVVAQERHCKA